MSNAYLGDLTVNISWVIYERSYHNMQMIHHMEKEKNANKNNLIYMEIFKLNSKSAMKRLKICQKTYTSKNTKVTLKLIVILEFQAEKIKMQIS